MNFSAIVIGTQQGDLYAYRLSDGSLLWHQYIGHSMKGNSIACLTSEIIVATLDGQIFALDPQNGRQLWSQDCQPLWSMLFPGAESLSFNTPASEVAVLANETYVVVRIGARLIITLAAQGGAILWTYTSAARELALAGVGTTNLYVTEKDALNRKEVAAKVARYQQDPLTARRGLVIHATVAFTLVDGIERWITLDPDVALIHDGYTPSLMEVQDTLFMVGSDVARARTANGSIAWLKAVPLPFLSARYRVGRLAIEVPYICVAADAFLGCYHAVDGAILWHHFADPQGMTFFHYESIVIQQHIAFVAKGQYNPHQLIIEGYDVQSGDLVRSSKQAHLQFDSDLAYRMQGIAHFLLIPSISELSLIDSATMQCIWSASFDMRFCAFAPYFPYT